MKPTHKLILAVLLALFWTAPAMAGHFNVINKLPKTNPCKGIKTEYADLNKAVDDIIKSAVIGDIDKTVDAAAGDNKDTVDVEINVATDAASYQKAMHDAGTTRSDDEMQGWFDNAVAHTDLVEKDGKKKVMVFVFCGDHLKARLLDGNGARTIIHELVHAQLYAMSARGVPPDKEPYKEDDDSKFIEDQGRTGHADEHNSDFNKIVERLTNLFTDEKKKAEKKTTEKKGGGSTKTTSDKPKKHGKAPTEAATAPTGGVHFSIGVIGGDRRDDRRDDRHGDAPFGGANNNSGFKMH